jgi:hypothetical protein
MRESVAEHGQKLCFCFSALFPLYTLCATYATRVCKFSYLRTLVHKIRRFTAVTILIVVCLVMTLCSLDVMQMEAVCSSETLVTTNQATECQNPENLCFPTSKLSSPFPFFVGIAYELLDSRKFNININKDVIHLMHTFVMIKNRRVYKTMAWIKKYSFVIGETLQTQNS